MREGASSSAASGTNPVHGWSAAEGGALPRRVHLLGIGGAGLSGVARILHARGVEVSGHDRAESGMLEALRDLGLAIELGDGSPLELPEGVELVVRSAAVGDDDPRVRAARARGVPVHKYAEVLGRLAPAGRSLAVAGTHGKTTTAWLAWHALAARFEAARDARAPGALIGGLCRRRRTNALAGDPGGWFVAEACEYDRSFLRLSPSVAIVTNVEPDHLDYYGTFEAIVEAFARFVALVPADGLVVLGRDVPGEVEAAARAETWRLGREIGADLLGEERGRFRFRLRGPGWATPPIALSVPGAFQVENASLALAGVLGRSPDAGDRALAARGAAAFAGVERRFEPWGRAGGIEIVHDYAHHPTEVRVTIETARRAYPRHAVHVLFQPHQHSRTARFLGEFVESLRGADRVVVADVYGARHHIDGDVRAGARELALGLARAGVDAEAGGTLAASTMRFVERLPPDAVGLVLGAGDVEEVRDELLETLALRCASGREPVV